MIPKYRGRKIDSDEWVEGSSCGNYIFCNLTEYKHPYPFDLYELKTVQYEHIDPNTLAIHFPNMIDKNGKKIFASLGEDGVGGDVVEFGEVSFVDFTGVKNTEYVYREGIVIWGKDCIVIDCREVENLFNITNECKVIGTHKG